MAALSEATERPLGEFAGRTNVTADQVSNLRAVISHSPILASQVDAAISAGHLQHFELMPAGENAGGTYHGDTKTIKLPSASLSTPAGNGRLDTAELTFVLGHEIQHGFNHQATSDAYEAFEGELQTVVAGRTGHDYTTPIATLLAANRRDEATANIEGWNALVSQIRTADPNATLQELYDASPRAKDFVRMIPGPPASYATHADLTLNDDLSMTATPANIEGMARHYFDQGVSAKLGHNGNSDYQNLYGAYAIARACQYEAANPPPDGISRMEVNMQRLGLQERLLEENGLYLGEGTPPRQPYFDTSSAPSTLHYFDHTEGSHVHVPIAARSSALPVTPAVSRDQSAPSPSLDADRDLHEQIRNKVAELDAANGRSSDQYSERLSASLLVLARENGLDRVDHVVLSLQTADAASAQNVFVVKGALDDPASMRASMATAEATQRPVQDSLDSLALVNRRQIETASQEHERTQVQDQQRSQLSY